MTMNIFRIAMGFLFMAACGVYAHETFRGPTELIYYDREKAADGYVMFSVRPRLTEQGSIIQGLTNVEPRGMRPAGVEAEIRTTPPHTAIQELDWDGRLVWEFVDRRPGPIYHHSIKRIWNKKLQDWTMMFASQTGASVVDRKGNAGPDGVIEVDMRGNVVWQWWSLDHVVQDQNPELPNYGVIKDHPEKFDLNWGGAVAGPLIHINALDYNQTLDHVVVSNSRMSEFYVIDHGGTFVPGNVEASKALSAGRGGDILFRWGNPSVYDAGKGPSYEAKGIRRSEGDQRLHSSSDIQWIAEGLPGPEISWSSTMARTARLDFVRKSLKSIPTSAIIPTQNIFRKWPQVARPSKRCGASHPGNRTAFTARTRQACSVSPMETRS